MKNFLNPQRLKYLFLLVLLLTDGLILYALAAEDRAGVMSISFLDVGQGDAILIEAANGNQVLVDGGSGRQVLAALAAEMPFYDRTLDLVVASHPDADHIGGLTDVFKRYEVAGYMAPEVAADTGVYQALEAEVDRQKIKRITARRGMRVALDRGAYLLILFPDREVADWETNKASIVAKLVYGSTSVLLMGDSPEGIENYLGYLDPAQLKSDVLKAGHHGSKTSSSEDFITLVNPEYAVISAGKNNRYGHPHPEVMSRLVAADAVALRTDQAGTIVLKSNGESFSIK